MMFWSSKIKTESSKNRIASKKKESSSDKPGMQNFPGRIQREAWDADCLGRIQRQVRDAEFSGQNPTKGLGCRIFRAESKEKSGMQNVPARIQREAWDAVYDVQKPKRTWRDYLFPQSPTIETLGEQVFTGVNAKRM